MSGCRMLSLEAAETMVRGNVDRRQGRAETEEEKEREIWGAAKGVDFRVHPRGASAWTE